MAVRDLRVFPDPVLRQQCAEVDEIDETVLGLLDDLAQSMYAHKGVGLAAPQIGEAVRVITVDVDQREGEPKLIEMINPEIVEFSEEKSDYEEGCLSFPGEAEKVVRPARVTVRAMARDGKSVEVMAEGLLATALQHEIDHLDGVLLIDHISRLKRAMINKRMKKRARGMNS